MAETLYDFYPAEVDWRAEILDSDMDSEAVEGAFWQAYWYFPVMGRSDWALYPAEDLLPANNLYPKRARGGFKTLQNLRTSGEALVLKTTTRNADWEEAFFPEPGLAPGVPLWPGAGIAVFTDVYITELSGTQRDVNVYDVNVAFTRVNPLEA